MDEAVEALHTEEPERVPATLTRDQWREQQLHRIAFQQGLRLTKSFVATSALAISEPTGSMTNGT